MAGFTPPGSNEIFHIFGEGGGTSAAEELNYQCSVKYQFGQDLREAMDNGTVTNDNINSIASLIAVEAMAVVTNEELSPFAPQEINLANDGETLVIKWQDNVEHVISAFNVDSCVLVHTVSMK